jgi:hypothetical protein
VTALDQRPGDGEYAPYALLYVNATAAALEAARVSSVRTLLQQQVPALRALLRETDDDAAQRAYAPGKWTLLESLLHVADTERVFSYRLLRIARADETPLPGFDQDAWVPHSAANGRTLADILTEIEAVRNASIALIGSLDDAAAVRRGVSGGNSVSVRGLAWNIAGHFAHHLELTRTRYLGTP